MFTETYIAPEFRPPLCNHDCSSEVERHGKEYDDTEPEF